VAWIVRVVKIGAEGEGPATDVMEINRLGDLADIANLGERGLMLAETKQCWLAFNRGFCCNVWTLVAGHLREGIGSC
jgi:hypothetical protein